MSQDNPEIKASDIIAEEESLLGTTNLDTTDYLPWISHAYQKLYKAIVAAGQQAKEFYFGDDITFNLTGGTGEYSLKTNIPRFGGVIKIEIKYGGTSDLWTKATKLPSISNYSPGMNNVSTTYRAKESPLYYKNGDDLGFIPTPPADDPGTPQAKVWFVKKPYQINDGSDVIDIPYEYLEPLSDYVQKKAIQSENESYVESLEIERIFEAKCKQITEQVTDEFGENEGTDSIQPMSGSRLYSNPLGR